MEQLISKMQQYENLNLVIKAWCHENSIVEPKIIAYSLERVSKLYDNYLEKYGSKNNLLSEKHNLHQPIWFQNELILFHWAVVAYSLSKHIFVKDFTSSEIQFLSSIFRQKEFYVIDYEIKCMVIKGKQIRNGWKIQEQQLLRKIIKEMPQKNKWNQIARQLYKVSGGLYFRQGKHCRERWHSYIQNRSNKKTWNVERDIQLLELVSVMGKDWSSIANNFTTFQNASQIKKRFKTLVQEVKNRFDGQVSDQQSLDLLLRQKYLQLTSGKKILYKKKQNPLISKRTFQAQLPSVQQRIVPQVQPCQNQSIIRSECQKMQNQIGTMFESNQVQRKAELKQMIQLPDHQNWNYFPCQTHIFTGTENIQNMSMNMQPQISSIFNINTSQCLNWWNASLMYQPTSWYFSY